MLKQLIEAADEMYSAVIAMDSDVVMMDDVGGRTKQALDAYAAASNAYRKTRLKYVATGECEMILNGELLSEAQVATLRMSLAAFIRLMEGKDDWLTRHWLEQLRGVHKLMEDTDTDVIQPGS